MPSMPNPFSRAHDASKPNEDFLPVRPDTFSTEKENKGILRLPKGGNKEDLMKAMDAMPSYKEERERQHPTWPRLEMDTSNFAKTTKPAVVTSKKAKKDYGNIKAKHADILMGMSNQKMRVDAEMAQKTAMKTAETQNQNAMQHDMQKTQMTNDTTNQKNTMDFSIRQQELELKRIALAQP